MARGGGGGGMGGGEGGRGGGGGGANVPGASDLRHWRAVPAVVGNRCRSAGPSTVWAGCAKARERAEASGPITY